MTGVLDEAGLDQLALELGRALGPGEVIWLQGELGAGKTSFVRALVRGLGVTTPATSEKGGASFESLAFAAVITLSPTRAFWCTPV